MDGIESRGRLVIVAATNRPNVIDTALRRPGRFVELIEHFSIFLISDIILFLFYLIYNGNRFDREVAIDIPTEQERYKILKSKTSMMPLDDDVDLSMANRLTDAIVQLIN